MIANRKARTGAAAAATLIALSALSVTTAAPAMAGTLATPSGTFSCPYYAHKTFESNGFRASASQCSRVLDYGGYTKARLAVSCTFGFTYRTDYTKMEPNKFYSFVSPKMTESGCFFGVSSYWLEEA
ncbi:hypothetical protein [Actinomadura hibisca]|uniref:hypothetical protein n=1 Tax=Actinomadura hibisca TaxID=68565 RepID=UPI00083554B0|nr:hypothetical protein [Actinomadura hibisca]